MPRPVDTTARPLATLGMSDDDLISVPIHPGEILEEDLLKPLNLSQRKLADAIGVPPRRINEIVHGQRAVTADTALRLARDRIGAELEGIGSLEKARR